MSRRGPARSSSKQKVLVALGGNAILSQSGRGTAEEQMEQVRSTAKSLAGLVRHGHSLAITHGNGPQVGDILLQNEIARKTLPPMPLDVCGAESQGMIGYMLQQAMDDELRAEGLGVPVVTVLTRTLVDLSDPAFQNPTKPIGPFYGPREASALRKEKGWELIKDSGRGYRRVVPSPMPVDILEREIIRKLFSSGTVVIAAGGGGIPVAKTPGGKLMGVEAVLDKDRTAALLAGILHTDVLMILTDVERVFLDFLGPNKRPLSRIDAATCERYLNEGQFPAGSMGPKIESSIRFLRDGGSRAVITSLAMAEEALAGKAGTTIFP